MKIIQAMKQIKDLTVKAEDLRKKVAAHAAHLSTNKPVYEDQKGQIREWVQSHHDIVKEILRLRIAIQLTNLHTAVTIEIGGKHIKKSIAEWVHRRRDLAKMEQAMWQGLTDNNLREGPVQLMPQAEPFQVSIVRYYDPKERDAQVELYRYEVGKIDADLEIVNATTDIIEALPTIE